MSNHSDREALRAHHRQQPFPHEGGCVRCREVMLCNVCGNILRAWESCTNGRCEPCHLNVCGAGGSSDPGHGFGPRSRAERAADLRGWKPGDGEGA
jgi:hypothetical protein